jgi:hypothetical protein
MPAHVSVTRVRSNVAFFQLNSTNQKKQSKPWKGAILPTERTGRSVLLVRVVVA